MNLRKTVCGHRLSGLILLLLLTGGLNATARQGDSSGPTLLHPKGWNVEEVAYPPVWAKSLPWKGELKLRFSPGMFKAGDSSFWSYVILYWLEGDVLQSRTDLEKALRLYDAGLYDGQFPAKQIRIRIGPDRRTQKDRHPVIRRSVTLDGFDPFATKKPITTHLELFRWYCPEARRTTVLILRSARPFAEKDPVWKTLLPFYEQFHCHKQAGADNRKTAGPE